MVFRWHAGERGGLAVVTMGTIPVVALGSIVALARAGHSGDETARVDAARIRARELRCLAENIYYEARGESLNGQYAVAEVTMNRLRSPGFPKTICGVVYDTRWDAIRHRFVGHFSWTEDSQRNDPWGPAWDQAMKVATAVYNDTYMPLVPDAIDPDSVHA